MDHAQFLQKLQEVLELPESLSGSERLDNLEGWDSMALISFMAMVDEHFGRKLSPRDIGACETVDDLYKLANGQR